MSQWESVPTALDDNTKKFLDFLAKAEGADYNTIVGGSRFDKFDSHPNVVGLRTKEGPSTAAGRYQITNTTYNDIAPRLGIKDFSPESQDKIALELIKRGGALEDIQKGDYRTAVNKLGGTWASLPSSPYSQPKKSMEWVEKALDLVVSPANAKTMAKENQWEDVPVQSSGTAGGGWEDVPVAGGNQEQKPISRWDLLKQEGSKVLKRTDDLVRGVADMATFGYADEIAAKLDSIAPSWLSQTGKTNYEDALKAQRQIDKDASGFRTAGQVIGGLVPTVGVVRAVDGASRLARAGAGAATGTIQGALYGSGSAEGDIGDRITGGLIGGGTGALLGGTIGALTPQTIAQRANAFEKRAGTPENARLDSEIVRDMNDVFQREVRQQGGKVRPAAAIDANAFESRYVNEARQALDKLKGKNIPNLETIQFELANKGSTPSVVLESLEKTKPGRAVVDALMKADRVRTLTGQQLSTGGAVGSAARMGVEASPAVISAATGVPAYLPRAAMEGLTNKLGGSVPRARVINKLLDPRNVEASQIVGDRLGPSRATQSMAQLQEMAQRAQASTQARAAQEQAAKVAKMAEEAALKTKTLSEAAAVRQSQGKAGRPISGAYTEFLERTNLTNEEALPILRKISTDFKGTELAKAATELRKSSDVKNESAFYSLQDTVKDILGGANPKDLSQVAKAASGKGNQVSKIVYGLPDEQVAQLLGRNTDTLGQSITSAKAYLTTAASRAFETYKKDPAKVTQAETDLLKSLGLVKGPSLDVKVESWYK